ncbi:type I restriction enzyme subunit R domain-containing protein [Fibrella aquatilis]|uniref:Type I restriction endonuclease subunit R n=1 Tax=Fibrella aquatilis TaxID=2817059 RepID=A0A939G7X7_9BACT|nr:DEAD/DEAH box helicase family protein [Fibrella aquatilis]MBO0932279.1 type I restriction endonuclease subunit R [Fibrella aquatilis]
MNELDLQEKYLIQFLCQRPDGLGYHEVKANTVSASFFVVEDLANFLRDTTINRDNYRKLLPKFGSEKALLAAFMTFLSTRIAESANMAVFFNNNRSVTFEGIKFHLFYTSGTETHEDSLFDENLFAVVQELPYSQKHEGKMRFSFRPDLTFFLNGIYLGYSELKSNYSNQNARDHGRRKVARDYGQAVQSYLELAHGNDAAQSLRRDFLKVFEKAIHITATDVQDTYVTRSLAGQFDELRATLANGTYDIDTYQKRVMADFKPYPLRRPDSSRTERFEEVFRALYDKRMIEKEILYYNFIERELVKPEGSNQKEYKHSDGRLISPRPKQKFGADKILSRIDELLTHEAEPDYLINKLRQELVNLGVGDVQIQELIARRQKFQNNRTVYSLLLQYAAGFGKSNIIGWTALQLKDLRRDREYVYDKVMLVVDRLQLRDQLDTKMHNMNIQKSMFVEATNKATFLDALSGAKRIVVVNLQKFGGVADALTPDVVARLATLRVAFLIDEIHRSNAGEMHERMMNIFDELQTVFDGNDTYLKQHTKKNLIIGFTATPSDHTLARFGEFAKYAENQPIWVPFDSYTMREAIEDGYILNPLKGLVPVSAKMYFELPDNVLAGFEGDTGYAAQEIPDNTDTGVGADGKKYSIRKKLIYENEDRIKAIAHFVTERLVTSVYHSIRGTGKAMLAVSSIRAAIRYKQLIDKFYAEAVQQKKYERFKDAPIYIVYSSSGQTHPASNSLNDGLPEEIVLQNFAIKKNGLLIVVDKLQTGFDEPKLQTLFLDKEIEGINAIQTISRVNRTTKYKNDCKIVDFSYKNVNVRNIQNAFAHFSNVVVSDFDPLGNEEKLAVYYADLQQHVLFVNHFDAFVRYECGDKDISIILALEDAIADYIRQQPKEAADLKGRLNHYFRILNLIETIILVEPKFVEEHFLAFWRRYNNEYNNIHPRKELVDDVDIYFDNKIGIVVPKDYEEKLRQKPPVVGEPKSGYSSGKYTFSISDVIAKRNQEEEAIEELIHDFEAKVELFFSYVRSDEAGRRVMAKMRDSGTAFDVEEIYDDFSKLYRKFIRRNKELGEFFIRETQDIVNQLCDDFERTLSLPTI